MASELMALIQEQSPQANIEVVADDIICVTKMNWEYLEALKFQEWANRFVYEKKNISIIILTSHPTCLTLGRGLQRKAGDVTDLVDFDSNIINRLSIPVHSIKRGGGVTFHHPGQLVIYPIINLTTYNLKVYGVMSKLFKIVTEVLADEFNLSGFDYCRDLLGLWKGSKKYASIGLQVRRFVTFHGLALNLVEDSLLKSNISLIYPCGLPHDTYGFIENLIGQPFAVGELNSRLKDKLPLLTCSP